MVFVSWWVEADGFGCWVGAFGLVEEAVGFGEEIMVSSFAQAGDADRCGCAEWGERGADAGCDRSCKCFGVCA